MICPNCNKTCADGSTFCPHCEAVLDSSILGDLAALEAPEGEATPVPQQPKAPAAKPRRRAPVDEAPEAPPEPAAAAGSEGFSNKYSQYWTEDAPAKQPPPPARVADNPAALEGFKSNVEDPSEQLKALWTAFQALHFEDKLTSVSAFGLFVVSFMPWRTTAADGDDMGFLTWGFLTALLAVAAIGSIWARRTGRIQAVPPARAPLLAVGAGGLSALIAALFALLSYERTTQLGAVVVSSEPAFGVFLSLIAAAGVVVGGVLTAKRER